MEKNGVCVLVTRYMCGSVFVYCSGTPPTVPGATLV